MQTDDDLYVNMASGKDVNSENRRKSKIGSFDTSVDEPVDLDAAADDQNRDGFFALNYVDWTNADHARLLSIDDLHTRLLEYHNNVHARAIYGVDGHNIAHSTTDFLVATANSTEPSSPSKSMNNEHSRFGSDDVIQVKHFSANTKMDSPKFLNYKSMNIWLDKHYTKNPQLNSELLWVHIKDPAVLPTIAERFDMHELCHAGFSDLRAYSSFIPLHGSVFLSFCTFSLGIKKANMFKVFIYVTKNVVVTFEREIMPDLLEIDGPIQDNVCTTVMSQHHKLHKNCCNLGGVYLMYCLALQSLSMQDTVIDFFSRALYYFKQKVSTRQYHKEKLKVARQMHCVSVSVTMIKNSVIHAEESYVRLLSGAMTGMFETTEEEDNNNNNNNNNKDESKKQQKPVGVQIVQINGVKGTMTTKAKVALLSPVGLMTPDHTPYLLDIVDSYKFANHILLTELEEIQALTGAMDALTTLRSINTSTLLSFVATIFLPLNFVCGIFGTNFVDPDGYYFMPILNDPKGPIWFLVMCLGSVSLIVLYFWYNGWIDFRMTSSTLWNMFTFGCFTPKKSLHQIDKNF
jgi:Mg2+ and Co2+ transporter CorA